MKWIWVFVGMLGCNASDVCDDKTKQFICRYCTAPFCSSKLLSDHVYRHCRGAPDETINRRKIRKGANCRFCFKSFKTKNGTLEHEEMYCKLAPEDIVSKRKHLRIACPYCHENFCRKTSLPEVRIINL